MSHYDNDMDHRFDERRSQIEHGEAWTAQNYKARGLRFLRYLSTRQMEVWGFFAAGFIISKIL